MNFQLDSIIEVLLSNDNQRRIEAERFIDEIPTNSFEPGIDAFLSSMAHENPNVASMGALLLKKKYLDPKSGQIEKISQDRLSHIVACVRNSMSSERPVTFLKRCCEILVRIYSSANIKDELVTVIQQLNCMEATNMKLALMYFIEIICESAFNDDLLMKYSKNLEAIFQKGLEDQSNQVKVAAFKTLTVFLSSITDEKMLKSFAGVLKILISKCIELVKFDQQSGIVAMESLNELVESHPKFIKPIFENLLMIYAEIMEASGLLVNLRTTAMAGILILCNQHHTMVRKSGYFKKKMVPAYINMLSEIESTPMDEWADELIDEVVSKNDISMSTEEHLSQISNELGNKFILPLFVPLITECLTNQEIKYQHAGLTALAILIENCHESFKGELKNMIGLMLPLLQSQNPRIIYDILVTMGYMASEFAPEIQTNFGDMILEFIYRGLCHPMIKVQYKAALCIVNFAEGIQEHPDIKVMQPYLDRLLTQIATLFEKASMNSNYVMLEGILQSISVIAQTNNFSKYYSTFMPGLVKIVSMIAGDTPQKTNIKSHAIEAMGDLLASVKDNKELFVPECDNIMRSLITLQSQIDNEDILHRAIFKAYENIVEVLGKEFIVYSDAIFTQVYEAAARKIDVHIYDQMQTKKDIQTASHKYVKIKLDLKIDGVKNVVLNTDTFQQKIQATNLLSAMTEHMGENFFKYVEYMYPLIEELIILKNSKEMRGNMIDCCKFMIIAGRTLEEKNAIIVRFHHLLRKALGEAITAKDHSESAAIMEAYSMNMNAMTPDVAKDLPDMMTSTLAMVRNLTTEIEKIYADKEMDEDLQEQMSNQIEQVEQPLQYIEDIIKAAPGAMEFQAIKKYFPKDYEFTN